MQSKFINKPAPVRDISFDLRLDARVFVLPPPPGVLANDSDPDGDSLSAELVSPPSHGTLQFAANGSFTYTPADDFSGQDTFTYRASDGAATSNVATVTIEVRGNVPENHPPVANPDEYSTPAGHVLRVGGPSDPNGNTTRTLIARGATWRYLDNGTDQGTAWRQLDFNDQSWATGPAELGYGDGDEATVVDCGPRPATNAIQAISRKNSSRHISAGTCRSTIPRPFPTFDWESTSMMASSFISTARKSSAATFPLAKSASIRWPIAAIEDLRYLEPVADRARRCSARATMLIAAEIHQQSPLSSDISFDLDLVATSNEPPPAGSVGQRYRCGRRQR